MPEVHTGEKPIEGQFKEQGEEQRDLAVIPPQAVALSTVDPTEFLDRAIKQANALAAIIKAKNLAITIGGGSKPHVLIDGWATLMALNGVMPYTMESRQARCVAGECQVQPPSTPCKGGRLTVHVVTEIRRVSDGTVLTRIEAECSQHENRWARADDYAVISMAQTRGVGKGCRQLFGWVMALAGFSSTPADEVPSTDERGHAPSGAPEQDATPPQATPVAPPKPAAKPWSDEHRDGFKEIYKAVNAQRGGDERAKAAIERFTTFMNKQAFSKWEYLWAHDDLRADAFRIFGMDDPALTAKVEPVATPDPTLPFDPDAIPT